jgi:hypothetical protein
MALIPTDEFFTDVELALIIGRSPFGRNRFEVDCGEYQRQRDGRWRLFIYKYAGSII